MQCRLDSSVTQGIPQLTAVNPYIASTLGIGARSPGAVDGRVLMPRQRSGSSSTESGLGSSGGAAGSSYTVGISGFAFQGTNAHVITGRCVALMNLVSLA